jgi:hypothetical protein
MDPDVQISQAFDIRIRFSVNMDIRIRIQYKYDVKWMYPYSFLKKLFFVQFHIRIRQKCEIFDIIRIRELQIILKPSKSYNYD